MQLELKKINNFLLINPIDKTIETFNSRDFKTQLVDIINQGHHFIILDFSDIDFIDSNGLGSLVAILKLVISKQGRIVISGAKDPIQKIFNLTRLNQVIPLFSNIDEALKFLQDHENSESSSAV